MVNIRLFALPCNCQFAPGCTGMRAPEGVDKWRAGRSVSAPPPDVRMGGNRKVPLCGIAPYPACSSRLPMGRYFRLKHAALFPESRAVTTAGNRCRGRSGTFRPKRLMCSLTSGFKWAGACTPERPPRVHMWNREAPSFRATGGLHWNTLPAARGSYSLRREATGGTATRPQGIFARHAVC